MKIISTFAPRNLIEAMMSSVTDMEKDDGSLRKERVVTRWIKAGGDNGKKDKK